MGVYTQSQWLLIFFTYCICGWIWESSFVSIKEHRPVNRGFLHGPWVPIYGSGAIVILFCTLPVRWSGALIFLFGMLGATILEYATGAIMERLFQMRYWDYSRMPLNLHGYVCLPASLLWGAFSVLLVRVLHPPVERLILALPVPAADAAGLVLSILFAMDATRSVQAALDIRDLLAGISENSRLLRNLEERLEAVSAQLADRPESLRERLREMEERIPQEHLHRIQDLKERSEEFRASIARQLHREPNEAERDRLEGLRQKLESVQESIRRLEAELSVRREKELRRAGSLLSRNPSAVSHQHRDALEELRRLIRKGRQDS